MMITALLSYPFGGVPPEGTETDDTYIVIIDIPYAIFVPCLISALAGLFLIVGDSNQKNRK